MHIIITTKDLVEYVKSLSYYIERVMITSVEDRKFKFAVQVPYWYKCTLGFFLKREIKSNIQTRMPIGVDFDFILYSKSLF